MTIRDVFTFAWLLEEAGDGPLARGVAYEIKGRVSITRDESERVDAFVRGTEPYVVELILEAGHPVWFCSCPAARDGSLCKHVVATALTLAESSAASTTAPAEAVPVSAPVGEAAAPPDVRAWRKLVTSTFATGGRFVEYRHVPEWAAGVHDLLDDIEELLDGGHAEAVVTLAEDAHRRAETAIGHIDDSGGWLTDIAGRVAELHQAAVARARPDPRALAKRLFKLELDSHTLDTFHRAAATYADALGDEGIARYREFVEATWAEVDHDGPRWENFRLREARVAVAIAAGDADELIAVKRNDLHSPDDHLEIAQTLADAGRTDEAVDWARRGLEKYADRWFQTPKLRDWLAQFLSDQNRPDEVADLYWDGFVRHPTLGTYRQLVDHAADPGATSTAAVAYLRDRVGSPVGPSGHAYPADPLIEILEHDGRHDDAWTLHLEHGCDHELAMRLAKRREADHPLDAIVVYDRDVEQHIARKNKTGYRAAVRQLVRIRKLADEADQPDIATGIIDRVRTEHRQKRNLMVLLDDTGSNVG
ncbi:MAG: SWIM zinc finger family protein [Nitriliruptoraceae bacterium]|nr:SWIM zinc finger family protein [Nitriliruptoraceae bacterium]